ncbi:hypothetical protein F4824DRAFT_469920 [Ustulina deusta]|nr:hypothetical protein F4824DRAFT_469920 [Ustulina deusta]
MADGSCGPSNAFKGLARHIEQDRSHQQDRVAPSPQHPAQNFRSAPLNSGLTAQFGAFQQQNAALPQHPSIGWKPYSHPTNLPSHPAQAATFFPQQPTQLPPGFSSSTSGNWVNDFQQMSFADGHTTPLHNQPTHSAIMGQPSVADTMRSNFAARQQPTFQPFRPPPGGLRPINHHVGMFPTNNDIQRPEVVENASLAFNAQTEAILEQEFEEAMHAWMLQNGPGTEMSDQNELSAQEGDNLTASPNATSAEPTAYDTPEKDPAGNRDELARAAQQLVDSLADNTSEKFKNSDFLALMRRIASQELTVQGNDLVETQPSTITNSSSYVTGTTSTAANEPVRTSSPGGNQRIV